MPAANLADSTSAPMLLAETSYREPTREHIWADLDYRGDKLQRVADGCELDFEVVERKTLGCWLGKHDCLRLAKALSIKR